MELDPKYADCIVRRWQEFKGRKATLESDGRTFEDVKRDRRIEGDDATKGEVVVEAEN